MNQLSFHAVTLNCLTDENHVHIIGFGDHPQNPGKYIIISQLEEEDTNVDDIIHMQTNINPGYYNVIKSIVVDKQEIIINLLENMTKKMGFEKAIITYDMQKINIDDFITYLKIIFKGSFVKISIHL